MLRYLQEHVYLDGDCRLWGGPFNRGGTPRVMWNRVTYPARRLLLQLLGQELPEGAKTYATCGNPSCMSPEHVKAGKQRDVVRNTKRLGRFPKGTPRSRIGVISHSRLAKMPITERDRVAEMVAAGKTQKEIGEVYGITGSAVSSALKNWRRAGLIDW